MAYKIFVAVALFVENFRLSPLILQCLENMLRIFPYFHLNGTLPIGIQNVVMAILWEWHCKKLQVVSQLFY